MEEMLSLYEYLGKAAGNKLGQAVYEKAKQQKVTVSKRDIQTKTYKGKVLLYPKSFLDSYFKPVQNTTPQLAFTL